MNQIQLNPKLDLVLERIVDVPRELVWAAWTTPEHIKQWFTPVPWQTVDCKIDLRPGGMFFTVMRSPEGQDYPNTGCYLEVIQNERLTWTDRLSPGFRPSSNSINDHPFFVTASITLEPHANGCKYNATVMHSDEESRKKHEEMGFHEGWGTVLDQLVAFVKKK
ncbi:SRPBCC family protein [Leptospira ilyithenensis]|uniref:Polyketide cyclase n=1 Tax=Leptospira ilyithenensis TaxID=2484901 RepID=A0A4V3JXB8_9LEPT|nr:SRPBCC family protein [Leptospira ilyithenensis]TGN13164.1 polyketide cyclase [Leptospira ilyithenensis]